MDLSNPLDQPVGDEHAAKSVFHLVLFFKCGTSPPSPVDKLDL